VLLVIVLLQKQVGAGGEEGVRRLFGGDHWNGMAVLGAEPEEKVEHLAGLTDGLADVVKGIGELLEMGGAAGCPCRLGAVKLPLSLLELADAWPPELVLEPPSPGVEEVDRELLDPPVAIKVCWAADLACSLS
jgi:hypothetical protein